jgi:hypothetical protein
MKKNRVAPVRGRKIMRKARRLKGSLTRQRIDQTGLTSRVRGHVSARGKRAQAKRDAR